MGQELEDLDLRQELGGGEASMWRRNPLGGGGEPSLMWPMRRAGAMAEGDTL